MTEKLTLTNVLLSVLVVMMAAQWLNQPPEPSVRADEQSVAVEDGMQLPLTENAIRLTERISLAVQQNDSDFAKCKTMEATAYSGSFNGSSATRLGIEPFYHSKAQRGIVAVDPTHFIPLQSIVWIEGYGVAFAADTGADIKGNRIDVYFDTEYSARHWGRQDVEVCRLMPPGNHDKFGFPDPQHH